MTILAQVILQIVAPEVASPPTIELLAWKPLKETRKDSGLTSGTIVLTSASRNLKAEIPAVTAVVPSAPARAFDVVLRQVETPPSPAVLKTVQAPQPRPAVSNEQSRSDTLASTRKAQTEEPTPEVAAPPRMSNPVRLPPPPMTGGYVLPEPTPQAGFGNQRASLVAAGWELSSAIKALSGQTGVSIILLTKEDAKVTVQLQNMAVADILRVLAALTDLRVVQLNDAYAIGNEATLKSAFPREFGEQYPASAATTEIKVNSYTFRHADPAQAVTTLRELMGETKDLTIAVSPGSRVPTLDGGAPTGGAVTGGGSGAGGASGGAGGGASPAGGSSGPAGTGRTVVLRGSPKLVDEAVKVLAALDERRPMVNVAVSIHDVNDESLRELGLNWTYGNVRLTERTPTGIAFETVDRSPLTFESVIRALETKDKARILAEPRVSVLDGQSAYILIGQRINYPVVTGLSPNNTPIFDIKEERVGVYFQVGAQVTEKDEVLMTLYPQVSAITGFLDVNGASYPQVSTREARTVLRVKSGDTVIVGGLIRDEEIRQWQKVPILGDIPLFGELFKRSRTTRENSQVIISITPTIMSDDRAPGSS